MGRVEDWVALAHLLAKANRLDEAVVRVNRAVEVSRDVADYYCLQSLLKRLKRFEEAVRVAARALELNRRRVDC